MIIAAVDKYCFPKSKRLADKSAISAVFDQPLIKASSNIGMILSRPNDQNHSRVVIIVAKKNIKKAVTRNAIKRQIRESFRTRILSSKTFSCGVNMDYVFLVRKAFDLNIQSKHKLSELCDALKKRMKQKLEIIEVSETNYLLDVQKSHSITEQAAAPVFSR